MSPTVTSSAVYSAYASKSISAQSISPMGSHEFCELALLADSEVSEPPVFGDSALLGGFRLVPSITTRGSCGSGVTVGSAYEGACISPSTKPADIAAKKHLNTYSPSRSNERMSQASEFRLSPNTRLMSSITPVDGSDDLDSLYSDSFADIRANIKVTGLSSWTSILLSSHSPPLK